MARNTFANELTFNAESDGAEIPLELAVSPRRSSGFVTGAVGRNVPEIAECPYCGTPGCVDRGTTSCARCGAPLRSTVPPLPPASGFSSATPLPPASRFSSAAPLPAAPPPLPSRGEAFVDAAATIPFAFWKRLPFYAFLAMVLGNGCLCGGLSGRTNGALALLIVVGLVGVVLSLQRRP